ncbi:endogenous retrovirus group K member 113 Pro protein-like [Thomomys bottae]
MTIEGLLDTGADISIIDAQHWPKQWPLQKADCTLRGLGFSQSPDRSAQVLSWQVEEGHKGTLQPYVLASLPITLWGRDILQQMGVHLTTEPVKEDKESWIRPESGYYPVKKDPIPKALTVFTDGSSLGIAAVVTRNTRLIRQTVETARKLVGQDEDFYECGSPSESMRQ